MIFTGLDWFCNSSNGLTRKLAGLILVQSAYLLDSTCNYPSTQWVISGQISPFNALSPIHVNLYLINIYSGIIFHWKKKLFHFDDWWWGDKYTIIRGAGNLFNTWVHECGGPNLTKRHVLCDRWISSPSTELCPS